MSILTAVVLANLLVSLSDWFFFGFLILMLGVRHPPPLNDLTRLDASRKLIGIAAVAILLVTFIPQPFVVVGSQTSLVFEAPTGGRITQLNGTVALGASTVLTFALNHTAPVREDVVVTATGQNLVSFGFTIQFTEVRIGSNAIPLNNDTVTVRLNATERAVFDLQVTAPTTWPAPLPVLVDLTVRATTLLETSAADLRVKLRVTP